MKKKSLLLSGGYVIIIERDCTKICDEAGGCVAFVGPDEIDGFPAENVRKNAGAKEVRIYG